MVKVYPSNLLVHLPYNHSTDLVLNRILHVPTISKNLPSFSQFTRDNSVSLEFHPNVCRVKSQGSNEILLKGHLGSNGLYTLTKLLSNSTSSSSFTKSTSKSDLLSSIVKTHFPVNSAFVNTVSTNTWHSRLGHPIVATQKLVMRLCNISFNNKNELDFCNSCCLGKAQQIHSPLSSTSYSTPLELIFSDLWGPAPFVSSTSYTYYVTSIDACTRYTWTFLLKSKTQTLNVFKQFKAMAEKQF